jgi:transcriptional regulator with XRE-family HTH domain
MYNFDGGAKMSIIGDNIKKYREAKGLKQEQIADAIGKSKNVVSNWERGDNKPDADTIPLLCGLLGVDANTLMGWDNTEQLKADAKGLEEKIINNPAIKEFLPEIADMSRDDLELLINLVKKIKNK